MILFILLMLQAPVDHWDLGNQAYADEQYEQALEHYKSLLDQGTENGLIHYNIGNTYFKLGDIGRSTLHFYKAQRFLPADDDIQYNLDLASEARVDPVIDEEQDRFVRTIDRMLYRLPYSLFFYAALLGLFTAFAVSLVLLFRSEISRVLGYLMVITGLLGLIALGITSLQYRHLTRTDFGVIIATEVDMLSGPSKKETTIYSIHAGIRCQILDEASGWYRIRLANGYNGWIPANNLEKI